MQVERWNVERDGPVTEALLRRKLEGLGYSVSRYDYPPGTRFPDHTHGVDKIDAVLRGRFRVTVERYRSLPAIERFIRVSTPLQTIFFTARFLAGGFTNYLKSFGLVELERSVIQLVYACDQRVPHAFDMIEQLSADTPALTFGADE